MFIFCPCAGEELNKLAKNALPAVDTPRMGEGGMALGAGGWGGRVVFFFQFFEKSGLTQQRSCCFVGPRVWHGRQQPDISAFDGSFRVLLAFSAVYHACHRRYWH